MERDNLHNTQESRLALLSLTDLCGRQCLEGMAVASCKDDLRMVGTLFSCEGGKELEGVAGV